MPDSWFTVDRAGLAALLERRGKGFVLLELLQNAWDEDTTHVAVTLRPIQGRPAARLVVEDDSPDGFADLTHAFTLFAPSTKLGEAEKRGRFNLGEKLVLALCEEATIISTTGGYRFDATGRHPLRRRRDAGSIFEGVVRMTRAEVEEALALVRTVIPPTGITTVINGDQLENRTPIHSFTATLATEIADDEGRLSRTRRKTTIKVYAPYAGETPMIYELGIPVVGVDDRWSVDVGQKVPLNMERDNVTPAYLRALRTLVLNEMHGRVRAEDATATWVHEALASPDVTSEAVTDIVHKLFGKNAVVHDPSDPEANRIAAAQGRTVIPSRAFTKDAWANIRSAGSVRPAGQVTPSRKILTSADGVPPIPETEWTDGMQRVAAYARHMAQILLGFEIAVEFSPVGQYEGGGCPLAWYGSRTLTFNVRQLGRRFFDMPDPLRLDALLIHEFAHEFASNHLSSAFYDATCDLGAKAKAHAQEIGTQIGTP